MVKQENIVYHEGLVSYEERCQLMKQRGLVVWFTGLSGSGKSTIATRVEKALIEQGHPAYRLDGDNIRLGLNAGLGFSMEDRMENVRRVAEVAALFKDAGLIVLVCFISPLRSMRHLARERVKEGEFMEVYLQVDLEICKQRDPKGLYRKAKAGEIPEFTGITSPYELPESPDLVVDTVSMSPEDAAEYVLKAVFERIG